RARLPRQPLGRGAPGPPRCPCSLFRADGLLHRADLRQSLLPRRDRPPVVLRLPLFPRVGRSQLRRLHPLAPRAISHRVPRQRFFLRHFLRAIRRCPHCLFGWCRSPTLWLARRSRRPHLARLYRRPGADSIRDRNPRPSVTNVDNPCRLPHNIPPKSRCPTWPPLSNKTPLTLPLPFGAS